MRLTIGALILFAGFSTACWAAAAEDDNTIRPGIGLGEVKLGMKQDAVRKIVGKPDGSYELPTGEKVDYSVWKDKKPSTIRLIYSKGSNKLLQINCEAPAPATADGISLKSSMAEIKKTYGDLHVAEYGSGKAFEDYYDNVKKGIAFEFTGDKPKGKTLYSIIVHIPGSHVLPDKDERLLGAEPHGKKH